MAELQLLAFEINVVGAFFLPGACCQDPARFSSDDQFSFGVVVDMTADNDVEMLLLQLSDEAIAEVWTDIMGGSKQDFSVWLRESIKAGCLSPVLPEFVIQTEGANWLLLLRLLLLPLLLPD